MFSYDLDTDIQRVFNELYSDIPQIDWKRWLTISSNEEYESLSLELSGLSSIDNVFGRLREEKTDPRQISVDLTTLVDSSPSHPIIVCHTSGTSHGGSMKLKFFHMTKDLVRRLWAPGMQAIFETSGLNQRSRLAIFIPSRLQADGLVHVKGKTLIRLYSSEFSQRLVLSLIQPSTYLLDEYKNANTLSTIARLLSMEQIHVISAPASTILGWADLQRLRRGLQISFTNLREAHAHDSDAYEIVNRIEKHGVNTVAIEIQNKLTELLSEACLVFSTSSITQKEWSLIRKFMKWNRKSEKYTNLYVGSEIGPFAANLRCESVDPVLKDEMHVFPLTLAAIQHKGKIRTISCYNNLRGRLLVSRMDILDPVINLDPGDIIYVTNQEGLPKITGTILRAAFPLTSKPKISQKFQMPQEYDVYVGDYFNLPELEIVNPRHLIACLAKKCNIKITSPLILRPGLEDDFWSWILYIHQSNDLGIPELQKKLSLCPNGKNLMVAIQKKKLHIAGLKYNPIEISKPRSEILKLVRTGKLPKGVMKKWPIYVILPHTRKSY